MTGLYFPTTNGAYNTTFNGLTGQNAFVSRLDPKRNGGTQLVYSTFLGGSAQDEARAISVDASGVVTVGGHTRSGDFPTTGGAFDTSFNRGIRPLPVDGFVSRLDPSRSGSAQLDYSTYLGGLGDDFVTALAVNASGRVFAAGWSGSSDFPTTSFAYSTSYNGGFTDAFVCELLPGNLGQAGLLYSTFLGGSSSDAAWDLSVDSAGVMTLVGATASGDFPTTSSAYNQSLTTGSRNQDGFVSRLDPGKSGASQLVYSTYFGGSGSEWPHAVSFDAGGFVTVAGYTDSADLPTTSGAFDRIFNGAGDVFVSRLDLNRTGASQLVYSTYLGGSGTDWAYALSVDLAGLVTVSGLTRSTDFPTTNGAYRTNYNGGLEDGFIGRLDPSKIGVDQLVYSTHLGGSARDEIRALSVDAAGTAMVAGWTGSPNFVTTSGAYATTFTGPPLTSDAFVSRLSMGVAFFADRYELSLQQAGTQKLWINAGAVHANRSYAIFGSMTGTSPGITLTGIHIPLNIDPYTDITIGSAGPPIFVGFRGTLDSNGEATAEFNVPFLPTLPSFTLRHAYIVFDGTGKIHMASNAVPLHLK